MDACTTGATNTAVGTGALGGTDDGIGNVAIGAWAISSGNAGNYNIAIGEQALTDMAGTNNIGIGFQSIFDLVNGANNVALGHQALKTANGVESQNIAIGSYTMLSVDEGASQNADNNIAIGYSALTGGAVSGGDFIDNIAIGKEAMNSTGTNPQTGTIAIGANSLTALTSGEKNVAIGYESGKAVTTGERNVIIGYQAGLTTTNVDGAVIIGNYAGVSNMTEDADGTVAVGRSCGTNITSGIGNTAVGYGALYGEDDGDYNTAIGYAALNSQTGTSGTVGNTALGYKAGYAINTGMANTIVGYQAGDGITTGSQNTGIGADVAFDVDADNQTCVGFQATTDSGNDIAIGNTSVDEVKGQVDFSTFSDKRIKKDVVNNDLGLDFINLLKPRKFKKVNPNEYPDDIRKPLDGQDKEGNKFEWTDAQANKVWDGLIAQEVKEAIDKCGTTFSGWNEEKNSKQLLTYSTMVMPLIKAVQELSVKVEDLEKQLKDK